MEGIIVLGLLLALFVYAANKYHKGLKKIEQHKRDGNITLVDDEKQPMFPEVLIIELKARHLIGTDFLDKGNCAISKVLKEMFPDYSPVTYSEKVYITRKKQERNNNNVEHYEYDICRESHHEENEWVAWYHYSSFEEDMDRASGLHEDTVIRRIKLIKP